MYLFFQNQERNQLLVKQQVFHIYIFKQKLKNEYKKKKKKGSDLDGDCYFISWDKRLIPENMEDPFNYD